MPALKIKIKGLAEAKREFRQFRNT